MVVLYAIQLTNNKYFIGSTNKSMADIDRNQLLQIKHPWTTLYKPICISAWMMGGNGENDKDWWVKEYMNKYDIHSVRGGSFNTVELTQENLDSLNGINDICSGIEKMNR